MRRQVRLCYGRGMSENDRPAAGEGRRGLRKAHFRAGWVARAALGVIAAARRLAWGVLQVVLAVVIVFEEWGWQPLAAAMARLARLKPIAALEGGIARLPPYPALAVFALPSALLFPLKLVALWLVAQGHVVWATLLFAGAKVAGTALLARLFHLTQPALMQLGWFRRAYDVVMPWKHAVTEAVRASRVWRLGRVLKAYVKRRAAHLWQAARPIVLRLRSRLGGLFGGR